MSAESKYLYRPKWTKMLGVIVFFGVCAAVLFHVAKTNDRGLIIESIIELSPANATIFYYVLTFFSILFVLAGLGGMYAGLTGAKHLVINANELVIPPIGFARKEFKLQLNKPYKVNEFKINGQVMLKITSEGRSGTITKSMMENNSEYEEVRKTLWSRSMDAEPKP